MSNPNQSKCECGYYHDEDGICMNESCRKSICSEEWQYCKSCKGKGYVKKQE